MIDYLLKKPINEEQLRKLIIEKLGKSLSTDVQIYAIINQEYRCPEKMYYRVIDQMIEERQLSVGIHNYLIDRTINHQKPQ